ncbi:hypothetical protein F383_10580 [Gossypium arboreum]|uniref:Uncharacterized protein n=1 Tax=Gossypium arboreum TaxID=29729 RepID=A0A0B0PCY5_GOSAR|nr:hypothetical protein F383_10580 [Gossypium arboreum]
MYNSRMCICLGIKLMSSIRLSYDVRKPHMNLGIARIHMA